LSAPLLVPCEANGKYRAVKAEMDAWYGDFYGQNDIEGMLMENFKEHWFGVLFNMGFMRVCWELGFYHAAGKSFGRYDRMLMGYPKWTAAKAIAAPEPTEKMVVKGSGKDLVTFQSWGTDYAWGTKLQEKVHDCIKPDDVEFKVMEAAIFALNPYDEFSWTKYFEAT